MNIKYKLNKSFNEEFFKDCIILVEGDSDHICYFYDRILSNQDFVKKYNFTESDLKDGRYSICVNVATILDNPISVSYRQIFLRNKKIIFWETISQMVYYPAIEEYHNIINEKINFKQEPAISIINYIK